jgi:MoaA/NifB/PqqE/SkfB family radical SAM enzyme
MMRNIRLFGRMLKSNFHRLSNPYKLIYAATYACNSRCSVCNIWKKRIGQNKELQIDEIRKIFKESDFQWVGLTGGEPFMRSDIVEVVRAITEKCANLAVLTIPTNSLVNNTYQKIEEMSALPIPNLMITVSLDGDRTTHDAIRGVQGAFDKAIVLYKKLKTLSKKRKNLHVVLGYTFSEGNAGKFIRAFAEVKKRITDIILHDFHFNIYHVSAHFYANKTGMSRKTRTLIAQEIDEILHKRGASPNPMNIIDNWYLKNLITNVQSSYPKCCEAMSSSIFMDPYGHVYPCTIYGKKIGNMRNYDYTIAQLLNSGRAKSVLKEIESGHCPGCWTPCEAYQTMAAHLFRKVKIKYPANQRKENI